MGNRKTPLEGRVIIPLHPLLWQMPPPYRRFPDEIADVYEAEDTPLVDVCELWTWKHDLVADNRIGLGEPDSDKMAKRLGQEVADFLQIEENSREAIESAERELEEFRRSQEETP